MPPMGRASRLAAAASILALSLPACGGSGSSGPSSPADPAQPVPVSPTAGAAVESVNPTLVVRNAKDFGPGQATYDFVVLDAAGTTTVDEVLGVAAGNGRTQATVSRPLVQGAAYQWKAVARAGARTAESALASFEIGVACATGGDAYAKSVVESFVTACTRRTNKGARLDPAQVLGAPDARGNNDNNYSGFMSLGERGYVVVDMGTCARDQPGPDLRVYQYIEYEPVTVLVSGSPDGPWAPLGTRPCGDGGVPDVRSGHCDFDLADGGLKAARYVWVEDAENFPCEEAGTRTEGADIDAVEVLNLAP